MGKSPKNAPKSMKLQNNAEITNKYLISAQKDENLQINGYSYYFIIANHYTDL